ncbi:FadR/GntR family transcriptional regulator [Capnocytophaga stomatis]|uniref:FadR/GntR family transcriptional regulator n=1 Tax=Capnocytophaga stomatis TaxID=1848904 RepID=A0ABW8Q9V5_9FLAO|nr:FadR/GntR family transcriptional regulator [Capnocytophaga stomatis]GIJ94301.1 GntR family transcriptional regulator [Capnocytophaga stomatis]
MNMKLQPLESITLVDRIEQRITEYIRENNLKPGDSLPKEMELAEWLGVSRTAVREALLRMRTMGLVESKKHRGMVLKEPDLIFNIQRTIESKMLDESTLQDLFEFRLMFEIGMVDFVFARKTEEQVQELEALAKRANYEYIDNYFSLQDEFAFHSTLYKMASNQTLLRFQELLLPVFQYVHDLQAKEIPNLGTQNQLVTHIDLVEELKNGTPQSFREAMRMHLNPHFERMSTRRVI